MTPPSRGPQCAGRAPRRRCASRERVARDRFEQVEPAAEQVGGGPRPEPRLDARGQRRSARVTHGGHGIVAGWRKR